MPDRFEVIYNQDSSLLGDGYKILVDRETGVNYLQVALMNASGTSITTLLNSDGKPIVSSQEYLDNLK